MLLMPQTYAQVSRLSDTEEPASASEAGPFPAHCSGQWIEVHKIDLVTCNALRTILESLIGYNVDQDDVLCPGATVFERGKERGFQFGCIYRAVN